MSENVPDYITRSIQERQKMLEKILACDKKEVSELAKLLTWNGKMTIGHGTIVEHLYRNYGMMKEQGEDILKKMLAQGYFTKVGEDEYALNNNKKS